MSDKLKVLLVLAALLLPALYAGLDSRPVYKIQEVRIAETAREMLASGDYVVPRLNGELRLQKPPLPYWTTAASYALLGVNERAARIPSIIFSALTAWLLFSWLSRSSSMNAAANTALILVTSYIALRYSRSGEADASLMFFITAACYLGYRILDGSASRLHALLFYAALGLGFLTKGPAGIAIPLVTVLVAGLTARRLAYLKSSVSIAGLALLVMIAFGWYAWIFWQLPDIAQQFFSKQVDETFISGTHAKPVWWYIVHIFDFYLPWGLLIIPAAIWLYKGRKSTPPLPEIVRFALLWLAVVFVLLTFTVNKQVQYAMLFAPPLAILLGHYLHLAQGGFARCNRILFYLACVAAIGAIAYFARRHAALEWQSLLLAGIVVLPLLLRKWLAASAVSVPVLLVAGMTAMFYVLGEVNLASDPEKTDAPLLMAKIRHLDNLHQAWPGDGAVSYYAGRPIPPLKTKAIVDMVQAQHEALVIASEKPNIEGLTAQAVMSEGRLTLWKLQP
ncbi:MAG: glycosyltransferase family 39 protein [Pseudomonadota bacterium]